MPQPTSYKNYDPSIRDWVDFLSRPETKYTRYEVETPSQKDAMRLRFTFYNFLRACDRSKDAEWMEKANNFRQYMMQVDGNKLIFMPRSQTEMSQLLNTALMKAQMKQQSEDIPDFSNVEPPPFLRHQQPQTDADDALAKLGYFSRTARGENYNPEDDK